MSRYPGKDCSVTAGGNVISGVDSVSFDENAEIFTSIAFGDTAATQTTGIITSNGSLTYFHDPEDTSGQGALTIGSSLAIVIYPRGSANTASPQYSFTAVINSKSTPVTRDYAMRTVNFVISGDVTEVAA